MAKSAQRNSRQLLTDVLERLAKIESRLRKLEDSRSGEDDVFDSLEHVDASNWPVDVFQAEPSDELKRGRGRPPKISEANRNQRFTNLSVFLRLRWPKLKTGLTRRSSPERVRNAIADASPGAEETWVYKHLVEHRKTLHEFLHSGRYTGDYRQIASAMTCVPELAWRSSLDYFVRRRKPATR